MKERILEIMQRNSLTAWKFAEILEVQPSSISHILSGRNKPSFDFIEKVLLRFPEISSDWLVLGSGEMLRVSENQAEIEPEIVAENEINDTTISHSLFDGIEDEATNKPEELQPINITNVNNTESVYDDNENTVNITDVTQEKESKSDNNIPIVELFDKDIDKIVIFYKDRRFRTYYPE